jgi:tetraacyldisaccharide 4'-kinase
VLAFAGIGDPPRFFRTLEANGIDVGAARAFADHHPFSQSEIGALLGDARRDGLTLVTTEKDLARLGRAYAAASEIVAFKIRLEFSEEGRLHEFLSARLFKAREKKFQR